MTRDDVIRLAREAGASFDPRWGLAYNVGTATFERFAALVAATEREACARECEVIADQAAGARGEGAWDCYDAIRARGEKV